MLKYIIIFIATLGFGMEGVPPEKIEAVGNEITALLYKKDRKNFNDIVRLHYYSPDEPEMLLKQLADQLSQGQNELLRVYGTPGEKGILLGTKKIGRMTTALYLIECGLMDMPVRLIFVQRDELYYITGIQIGARVMEDAMTFGVTTQGGFSK